MKKLTAWILTLAMFCMIGAAAAEDGVTGEWYGLMYGAEVTLVFGEDGNYDMIAGGEKVSGGTYELKDGIVYMDGDEDPANGFVFDGSSLANEKYGVTFTRENNVQGVVLADVNPDAPLEAFAGEWICRYMNTTGVILDLKQVPDEMLQQMETIPAMKIEGTNVTVDGMNELFDTDTLSMTYADGALTTEMDDVTVRIEILQDGMAGLSVTVYGTDIGLWFEPAAAAE